jgi:glyoxylase-like metal-dependent hydrolase (beta-lactamase superfamily II)
MACLVAGGACLHAGCDRQKEPEPMIEKAEIVINRLVLGSIRTNCYCLTASESAKDCLIIDTGADHVEPLIDFLRDNALNPVAAVFTHGHHDHIKGATVLGKHFPDIEFAIHKNDAHALTRLAKSSKVDQIEKDGPIKLAGIKLEVFHMPGHTPGGISLYSESRAVVFTGDTLFARSVGKTDLPGGDSEQLIEGIKQKLLTLPEMTVVYPGHGPSTTIEKEKAANPFLQ